MGEIIVNVRFMFEVHILKLFTLGTRMQHKKGEEGKKYGYKT